LNEEALADRVLRGDRRALARAISMVENEEGGSSRLLESLGRRTGGAFVVGITGPPGTGKSTLVDRLIERCTRRRLRVGVLAVDPSSPFTGGALLGDRIRMAERALGRSVFMRSMASRGWSGGLSAATTDAVQILDASGFQVVFIETVGIGQADIEVMKIAHAVLVVLMPGMGDDVQMSKAGLMEIGDIYAINKSDLEGANQTMTNVISFARESPRKPSVVGVSAVKDHGIDRLMDEIERIRSRFDSEEGGREIRMRAIRGMLLQLARRDAVSELEKRIDEREFLEMISRIADHRMTLESAARRLARGR
jgi:LAO/AO transport system kinase